MMKWRIGLGALMIFILGGIFALDWYFSYSPPENALGPFLKDGLIIGIICLILCILGSLELTKLARAGNYNPFPTVMLIGSLALIIHTIVGWRLPDNAQIIGLLFLITVIAQFTRKQTDRATGNIAWTMFGIIYLGLLATFILKIRAEFGPAPLIMLIITAKGSDIGAFFTGHAIGKHKLIPWLSPGKTVEGLFGALVFAAVLATTFNYFTNAVPISIYATIGLGVIIGIVAHFGDLTESLLKRDCSVKDSASLIPEFGGILDLIDSILPASLIWYIILSIVQK